MSEVGTHRHRLFSMKKVLLLPVLMLFACLGVLANPAAAHADDDTPESWRITKYHVDAQARPDGTMQVDLTLDFDFADDEGHGPFVTLPEQQQIAGDPSHWRDIEYSNFQVSSPSGAPAQFEEGHENRSTVLQIGDKGTELTGVQTYQISYLATGVINPAGADHPDSDEINWNAVGEHWQVPIQNIEVKIDAPTGSQRLACFTGKKFKDACSAEPDRQGQQATFVDDGVATEEGVQVVAAYPAATFPGATIKTSHRGTFANFFAGNLASIGFGVAAVLGALGITRWLARRGRDEHYLGVAPGQLPPRNARDKVSREPVGDLAVQFRPPSGVTAAQAGIALHKEVRNADITAVIVDLAVRGHLRIVEIDAAPKKKAKQDWRLDLLEYPRSARPEERKLIDAMFVDGDSVTMSELKGAEFGKAVSSAKSALAAGANTGTKWFRADPVSGSWPALLIGCVLLFAGVIVGVVGGSTAPGWAYACLGLLTAAVLVIIAARHGIGRTPEGFAVFAQTKGFERYLTTAEADQLRFEEGVDIFSRYLPWAIVFGVADRWAKLFDELAARGVEVGNPGWYVGAHPVGFSSSMGSFTSGLAGFEAATSSSISSATSSSSGGGSGFSGGGGVGGGGGGGW